jgi:small subunit ribosomal protein S11e
MHKYSRFIQFQFDTIDAKSCYKIKNGALNYKLITVFLLFCSDVAPGDIVTVGECRPLSKTVRFNVLKVSKMAGSKKKFSKF